MTAFRVSAQGEASSRTEELGKAVRVKSLQLTLEQHKFELSGSTYEWIFFNKCVTIV